MFFASFAVLAGFAAWSAASPARAQAQSKDEPGYYSKAPSPEPGHAPKLSVQELRATGRTFKVGNSTGDEVMSGLLDFAVKNHVQNAEIRGLGGFSSAILAAYDTQKRAFKKFTIDQKCEVSSLTGNISTRNGQPNVHAHVVLSCVDGTTHGGHLVEGQVNPVMDLFVTEYEPASKAGN